MPCIEYEKHRFHSDGEELLFFIAQIVKRYQRQGFVLTLRQLYYQLVSKNHLPNTPKAYGRLSGIVSNGRMAGRIDWDMIVDMTREWCGNTHFDDVPDALDTLAGQYAINTRATQPTYLEVWIEKDALVGVIEPVCSKLDVSFLSCRGFLSQSELWSAAYKRLGPAAERGQDVVILHLADHDPSGIAMTKDLRKRLALFLPNASVAVKRIGLTMKQVQEFKLPPNPAKEKDRRFQEYQSRYGDQCWELDALTPEVIARLIHEHVQRYTEARKRDALLRRQEAEKSNLVKISRQWRNS
jgi:hypothetical protein